jgi:hypothetical protein
VAVTGEGRIWRRLLGGWTAIAGRFGQLQTVMLLALIYGILIGPVGLVLAAVRHDALGKRGLWAARSAWADADTAKPDLERAKRQS